MIDLFKYASDHNVSIEISPMSKVTMAYAIRLRREHYQMNTTICMESLRDLDEMLEFVLDSAVNKLDRYIAEIKMSGGSL